MTRVLGLIVLLVTSAAGYLYWTGSLGGDVVYGALNKYAIVQSRDAPELTLVDMRDDAIAGVLVLPVQPDQLLVSKGVDRIIFTNKAAKTVSIYDLALQSVEAEIDLPFAPDAMVLAPDGYSLALAGAEAQSVAVVSLVDQVLLGVVGEIPDPDTMTFSDSSEYVFVSDSIEGELTVIDAISVSKLDPVALSVGGTGEAAQLSAMTRTPNGLYGMVVDRESDRMSLLEFRRWAETTTIPLGRGPSRPFGTADGQYMLVANTGDESISVISTENFNVVATLPGVSSVTGISTGYFELLAFVVSDSENRAVLIDLDTMETAGEVVFSGTPGVPVSDANGTKIYVSIGDRNELVVYDAFNRKILKTLSNVGHHPTTVALAQSNNYCH